MRRKTIILLLSAVILLPGIYDREWGAGRDIDFDGAIEKQYGNPIGTNPPVLSRINYGYVREALINGIGYQEYLGVNPFKYGIVAGADAHTAFSDNEENNYTGAHVAVDDTVIRRRLAQKLEFLSNDLISPQPPTEDELRTYFEAHMARYRPPDLITMTHVFLDPDKRGNQTPRTPKPSRPNSLQWSSHPRTPVP